MARKDKRINEAVLGSSNANVSPEKIYKSLDNHWAAVIRYRSKVDKEGKHIKKRYIFPVAFGVSKAGNDVIRAYQINGDTNTIIPKWKFFRYDRIISWENKTFTNIDTKELKKILNAPYNENGDKLMIKIYKQATLGRRSKKKNKDVGDYTQTEPKDFKNTYKNDNQKNDNEKIDFAVSNNIKTTPITKKDVLQQTSTNNNNIKARKLANISGSQQNKEKSSSETPQQNTLYAPETFPVFKNQIEKGNENTPQISPEQLKNDENVKELNKWNKILGNISSEED